MSLTVNIDELQALASIVKAAQEKDEEKEEKKPKKRRKSSRYGEEAYPSYTRSLMRQAAPSPKGLGIQRGLSTGALGAILAALAARLATKDPKLVGGAAALGGVAGGIPGYISGKREAESERSRLRFLERLGITRPGELESALRFPSTIKRVTEEGVVL